MNSSNIETRVRPYQNGDEHQIVDLFRISSDRIRTVDFFKWANLINPFSQSISLLLESEDNSIVGHYSVMKVELVYKDRLIKAGFGAQLVIHPLFRNFKFMWQLLQAAWSKSREEGLDFIYAFPNNNIWPIKNKLMGWKLVKVFSSHELDLKQTNIIDSEVSEVEFQRIDNLSPYKDLINKIYEDSKNRFNNLVHIERNYDFVHWRFFQHPIEHYQFFLIRNKDKEFSGWTALKFYKKNDILYGHIVDLVVSNEDMYMDLVKHVVKHFASCGVDIVSLWGNKTTRYIYNEIGFVEKGFATNFGIILFENSILGQVDLYNYNSWDLAMSYSDAF